MLYTTASDLDLITDLRAGKHGALTEIFRRHYMFFSNYFRTESAL